MNLIMKSRIAAKTDQQLEAGIDSALSVLSHPEVETNLKAPVKNLLDALQAEKASRVHIMNPRNLYQTSQLVRWHIQNFGAVPEDLPQCYKCLKPHCIELYDDAYNADKYPETEDS